MPLFALTSNFFGPVGIVDLVAVVPVVVDHASSVEAGFGGSFFGGSLFGGLAAPFAFGGNGF